MSSDENSLFERVSPFPKTTMAGIMSLPLLHNNEDIININVNISDTSLNSNNNNNNNNNNKNCQNRHHSNFNVYYGDEIIKNDSSSSSNSKKNKVNKKNRKNKLLSSSSSSSSSFKPENFQFFSSMTYTEGPDAGAMLSELFNSSPTLYLIENSVSLSNHNLNEEEKAEAEAEAEAVANGVVESSCTTSHNFQSMLVGEEELELLDADEYDGLFSRRSNKDDEDDDENENNFRFSR